MRPLAYAAQALRGRGAAYLGGVRMPAARALDEAGLVPLGLDGRDALALVNGTSLTTAALALALAGVRASLRASAALTCLLVDLLGADPQFLDPRLIAAYAHPGAAEVAADMRRTLAGASPSGQRALQEPYSIRCSPQLLGAAEDALRYVDGVVAADLRSVSDNPLFFPADDAVVHGGNFFGQPAAFAADVLAVVPFGTQAGLLRLLCGSLALGLRQAPHVGARRPTAPGCAAVLDALTEAVPPIDPDRPLDGDVRTAAEVITAVTS